MEEELIQETAVQEGTEYTGGPSDVVDTTQYIDDPLDTSSTTTDETDPLETGSTEIPAPQSDAHRGTISSISTKENSETGSVTVLVALESTDTDQSHTFKFWPPKEFFQEEYWVNGLGGVKDLLPTEPEEGKKQSASQSFARNVASNTATGTEKTDANPAGIHAKDGVIQRLRKIAAYEGRTARGVGITVVPTSGTEYIEQLNTLCSGLSVIYKRVPDKQDGELTGFLKVQDILPQYVLDDPKADARYFKGVLKQWEQS